ncbi:MAG: nucleotidyltransferase domain-containing protein [Deltaproteobacteria bacterium]|nr:nucleotidyltransferase domain-containing protein [Deltaproteobacteria bacterium]
MTIRRDHMEIVKAVLARLLPDREVWAFGSRVRGTSKPFADLDLAVIGETPLPVSVSGALKEAFSESDIPYRVDVVDWATTTEEFRAIIGAEHVVIHPTTGPKTP